MYQASFMEINKFSPFLHPVESSGWAIKELGVFFLLRMDSGTWDVGENISEDGPI